MPNVNSSGNSSQVFSQPVIPPSVLQQSLKSGAIGAVVTLIVAGSIHKKDMIQTHQQPLPVDRFKAAFLFSAANIPKFATQSILYHLFTYSSKKPDDNSFKGVWKDFACSSGAGLLSTPFYNTFEHVALHYHENNQTKSLKEIFQTLYRKKRIQQGLCATSIRDLIFSCIYNSCAPLVSKKISTQIQGFKLSEPTREFIATAVGSSIVGAIGGILQTPADVLRAKRQQASLKTEKVVSYWQCAKVLGWKGLFVSWKTKASIGARAVPLFVLASKYL